MVVLVMISMEATSWATCYHLGMLKPPNFDELSEKLQRPLTPKFDKKVRKSVMKIHIFSLRMIYGWCGFALSLMSL